MAIPTLVSMESIATIPDQRPRPTSVLDMSAQQRDTALAQREEQAASVFAKVKYVDFVALFEESVSRSIATSLITQPWERVLGRRQYADLVGASTPSDDALREHRAVLQSILEGNAAEPNKLSSIAPVLAGDVADLARELSKQIALRLPLILDLSCTPWGRVHDETGERLLGAYHLALTSLVAGYKMWCEQSSVSSLTHLIRLGTAGALDSWDSLVYTRAESVVVPAYRQIDAYAILAHRYPRFTVGRGSSGDLASVLDSALLAEFSERMALTTAVDRLEGRLANLSEGAVEYRLRAREATQRQSTGRRQPARPKPFHDVLRLEAATPRVFLSYCHIDTDGTNYRDLVLRLANRLRHDRIDAELDQYEFPPPPDWPEWMFTMIDESDFVVIVCTEEYQRRCTRPSTLGRGTGVGWEGGVITSSLYEDHTRRGRRFIPVVLTGGSHDHVPYFLRHTTHYDVSTPEGYRLLLHHLRGVPPVTKPPLGG